MRIMITFPPLKGPGCPMLGQNRQFQWFNNPCYIYPMVPASAASLLKEKGFDVIWEDSIATGKTYNEFLNSVEEKRPDLVTIETKTPVIKQHWKIIDNLKKRAEGRWLLQTVLMGDHVTAMPAESMKECNVDFIITGGDYDFMLLNLCQNLSDNRGNFFPKGSERGIWYRRNGDISSTGKFQLNHDLNSLPFVERDLTQWKLYSEKNGNYKNLPGTYVMAGRDCWHHRCTFCSWTTLFPTFRTVKPERLVEEIGVLIKKYGVKEIMDDTGTFPTGEYLKRFCYLMIEKGYNKKINMDCNMRFGALTLDEYRLMKKAGFRLILFGLESGNDSTLKRLNKNLTVEQIKESCRDAHRAGLFPHLTVMFGYPWEGYEDVMKTVELAHFLMKKGYAYTLQATIIIPYPGTPLFYYCRKNNLLTTLDWDRYDMRESVMKNPMDKTTFHKAVQSLYKVAFNTEFLIRKVLSVRDVYDIKYFVRTARALIGHLTDFKASRRK